MPSEPADVIERIFTTANPETGSEPPPEMAWTVFENGTAFFAAPSTELPATSSLDDVAAAAIAALRELGPAVPGTSSADFNPVRLSGWFPDEEVWFVGFDSETIATIVVGGAQPVAVGLEGRAMRDADLAALRLVAVRAFDGSKR